MNYVIINGVNSNTIPGLLIQSLPPISKPLMRTEVVEIDGRDGDIVYDLGYSAYDKQISIGLHGNFDIDQVIKFFTGKGTVIFSNEPDKYYNFQIINQIDYQRLLRYRTATVTMHVQPYKYAVGETTSVDLDMIALSASAEGRGIKLENDGDSIHVYGTAISSGTISASLVSHTLNGESIMYWITGASDGGRFMLKVTVGGSSVYANPFNAEQCGYTILDMSNYDGNAVSGMVFSITEGQTIDVRLYMAYVGGSSTASISIENSGNVLSTPTYLLIGSKSWTMSIDGTAVGTFAMGTGATVYVDTMNLNAKKSDGTYFNRSVTGNYENMRLPIGTHTISFASSDTGASMFCVVEQPSRWI